MMHPLEMLDRKQIVRGLTTPSAGVKQRIQAAADSLNRVGAIAAQVELANEALCKLTAMLYQPDTDNRFANIDRTTGRLLVCAPWGNQGWKRWGLRQWEAVILRRAMLYRHTSNKAVPLFDYSTMTRSWYVNLAGYPSLENAKTYLQRYPITIAEWRHHCHQESARKVG
jgi:hypothetical protein